MLPYFEKKDTELFVYCYSEFGFSPHFHPFVEIVVAQSGQMGIVVDGKSNLLHEGEIGIIFPNHVHHYEYVPDTNSKGYLILIGMALIGEYRHDMEGRIPKNCVIRIDSLSPDCIHALEKLKSMETAPLRMQKAYARMVLCHLFDKLETVTCKKHEDETVYKLVDYMEKHCTENINLEAVAEALFVSKFTLSRIFSSRLGTSFNDYLNSIRIRYSLELLDKGSKISNAAFESGFNNLRTFNRAFIKATKKTPTEYLKTSPYRSRV